VHYFLLDQIKIAYQPRAPPPPSRTSFDILSA
jgi:hypothetical protein